MGSRLIWSRVVSVGVATALVSCAERDPIQPAVVSVLQVGDTIQLSVSPNLVGGGPVVPSAVVLDDLPFPTDVAPLADGRVAVLDRLDRSVVVFDSLGDELMRHGREGEGPGEYEEPMAISWSGSHLGVWDKSRRFTVLRTDGTVVATTDEVQGDFRTTWQRQPTTNWEEPLQLSREDVTRRISPLGKGVFGLLIQDRDERFDSTFLASGGPMRFPHHVVVVDSTGQVSDTLLRLEGHELRLRRGPTARTYAMAQERPFPLRPLWTAGQGWYAFGHGQSPTVTVVFDGGERVLITWPEDSRALADPDYHQFIDWELDGYRRTEGEIESDDLARIDRSAWIESELAISEERPQLTGMLADGRCLALAGFSPDQGPHAESATWLVLNLDAPSRVESVRVHDGPRFVRAFSGGRFYSIEVSELGTRRVHVSQQVTMSC